eukprot:5560701-Karenia_brevis.AAC.1
MGVRTTVRLQSSKRATQIEECKAGPAAESVSPLFHELGPVMWDKFGVGGEVEDEASGGEEVPEGVEPERIKLQEDGEVVKKIGDPMLPFEQE